MSMNIDTAKNVLLRRQAHLLGRIGKATYAHNHDERENQAISVVLFHIRKLEAENGVLAKPTISYDMKAVNELKALELKGK